MIEEIRGTIEEVEIINRTTVTIEEMIEIEGMIGETLGKVQNIN